MKLYELAAQSTVLLVSDDTLKKLHEAPLFSYTQVWGKVVEYSLNGTCFLVSESVPSGCVQAEWVNYAVVVEGITADDWKVEVLA